MRTNIEIDDNLMRKTLRATGLKTKREVVDLALKELLRLKRQGDFKSLWGKVDWQGDLEAMRLDNDTRRFERMDRLSPGYGGLTCVGT